MDPTDFLQDGTVSVSDATYAVCRTDHTHPGAFATIQDETETTVVVEQDTVETVDAHEIESGWTRLTFEMDLPFELVGFLAAVTSALAEVDVSVFVISTYSTDHVFVKEEELAAAVLQLEELGCHVTD
ncbi:ACT domain-containing protein [Haloarcula nitratireducens]|uniref:ACT domain-containing protein n=1 Tax=Haloarcula nitratireducens TaxID=2487749 RepID=A0AAW4PEW4_9EURY|nr:ACT domain-containing protein [Halomicroarcula nitratireducens]MBX0296505.1 ACT domain-containing protein [Halomicroarcula nitratireducens]